MSCLDDYLLRLEGAAGEGIGLVVMEDELKQELTVKSLSNNICIVSMKGIEVEHTARPCCILLPSCFLVNLGLVNDTILIGDRVMKVNRADVSSIPLIRLGQKLSDAVIPPATTVTLTLSRRIPTGKEWSVAATTKHHSWLLWCMNRWNG